MPHSAPACKIQSFLHHDLGAFLQRILLIIIAWLAVLNGFAQPATLYVSPKGADTNAGSLSAPFRSVKVALEKALLFAGKDAVIELRAGTYPLTHTLEINATDYRLHSLTIRAYKQENVTISGSERINVQWQPYRDGIWKATLTLPESPDQLFVNGRVMPMARYPNFDTTARVFNGTAADALSPDRVKRWENPSGGYVHALHQGEWGDFHYRIVAKNDTGGLVMEGGWQNNRPAPMHAHHRFVENIFEELDAPGEWFYDAAARTIYLYPAAGVDLKKATISLSHLNELISLKGDSRNPVKNVTVQGITFVETNRTFMLTKEPLLRSDWTIYRGGAILLDGTEHVAIRNCVFNKLGGNALFVSNYNKGTVILNNHIYSIGGSAIAFVGNPDAVRSPSFQYDQFVPWADMDFRPGPKSSNYPQQSLADGNLIHHIGTVEKQTAGVHIDMAASITVRYNSIYHTPRAGINIGDGCWGGHLLEYNDVFDTVLETGDHGAFNSWGRDRFWRPDRRTTDSLIVARPGVQFLDAIRPTIIRNNRFQCQHGWDIDLDDGSSNYRIYNNVCLNGGLKLREGYRREVTNNVLINNTFHPHVWYKNSHDVFAYNIVTMPYAPIQITDWGPRVDSNFFLSAKALEATRINKTDAHSLAGKPLFVDVINADYRVQPGSDALKIGFVNFSMNVGVRAPNLRKLAARSPVPNVLAEDRQSASAQLDWLGAKLKTIETLGERSAAGLHETKGVLVTDVRLGTVAAKNGLRKGDVIVKIGEQETATTYDFLEIIQRVAWTGKIEATIIRNQSEQRIKLTTKE